MDALRQGFCVILAVVASLLLGHVIAKVLAAAPHCLGWC